jgi:hypothetical protein
VSAFFLGWAAKLQFFRKAEHETVRKTEHESMEKENAEIEVTGNAYSRRAHRD